MPPITKTNEWILFRETPQDHSENHMTLITTVPPKLYTALNVKAQVVHTVTTYPSFTVTCVQQMQIVLPELTSNSTQPCAFNSSTSIMHAISKCNHSITFLSFYWHGVKSNVWRLLCVTEQYTTDIRSSRDAAPHISNLNARRGGSVAAEPLQAKEISFCVTEQYTTDIRSSRDAAPHISNLNARRGGSSRPSRFKRRKFPAVPTG